MHKILCGIITCCLIISTTALAVEFSADTVTQGMGQNRGKIYYKNATTHRSEVMGMIHITKDPYVYTLVESSQKYTVQNLDDLRKQNPMADYGNIKKMIEGNTLKKIGKEKLQGYKCVIYEGQLDIGPEHPPVPTKIWYSEKLQTPVRHEMEMGSPVGKIVTQLENITREKLESNLFDIPSEYQKVNSMQEAMGMGSFQMPSMGDQNNGQAPSAENMEKMMEQMQDMMKQMQQ
ncbi:MAG: DUF4412 domain-containing protein [Desulfopila sp.]